MIKHLNGWQMSKKLHDSYCKIYVKHFSGAKTICMQDFIKPSLQNKPDHFTLHVGTNDLVTDASSEQIAAAIIDVATLLKN